MIKQVIVVRTRYPHKNGGTYKPRTGKLISQAAHASLKVFLDRGKILLEPERFTFRLWKEAVPWLEDKFTKIVVGVESEEELLRLKSEADQAFIPNAIIVDSGVTEFNNVPTYTALAIGPYTDVEIDKITGNLSLL